MADMYHTTGFHNMKIRQEWDCYFILAFFHDYVGGFLFKAVSLIWQGGAEREGMKRIPWR